MWGLHCIDLAAPQVSRDGVSQLLCSHSPSLVLEVPVGFLIWLAWVQLWPCFLPALGQPTPGGGSVSKSSVRAFMSCLNLMLRFDSQDKA